jgi:hypothetical protein
VSSVSTSRESASDAHVWWQAGQEAALDCRRDAIVRRTRRHSGTLARRTTKKGGEVELHFAARVRVREI